MKNLLKIQSTMLFTLVLFTSYSVCAGVNDFSDVNIDDNFLPYLSNKKHFMSTPGVREFNTNNNERIIVCVVSMPSKGKSESDFVKMVKICRIKAQVELLKAKEYELSAFTRVEDKYICKNDGVRKEIKSLSSYLNVVEERVEGVVQAWPVIGTWFSKDEKEFYLAVGIVFSKESKISK